MLVHIHFLQKMGTHQLFKQEELYEKMVHYIFWTHKNHPEYCSSHNIGSVRKLQSITSSWKSCTNQQTWRWKRRWKTSVMNTANGALFHLVTAQYNEWISTPITTASKDLNDLKLLNWQGFWSWMLIVIYISSCSAKSEVMSLNIKNRTPTCKSL
jgi:hypothetical protein